MLLKPGSGCAAFVTLCCYNPVLVVPLLLHHVVIPGSGCAAFVTLCCYNPVLVVPLLLHYVVITRFWLCRFCYIMLL